MTNVKTVTLRGVEIGVGVPKIVVPIVDSDEDAIVSRAQSLRDAACDAVEWRVDTFARADDERAVIRALERLRNAAGDVPIIFTFRTSAEGGARSISRDEYARSNEAAARSRLADAIDVEISTPNAEQIISSIHSEGCAVIGSSHFFDRTPSKEYIVDRLRTTQKMGADILKIAVMPHDPSDVLTLLCATHEMRSRHAERPLVTISMGEGAISRIVGEYFGSSMTFGSVGPASAPGQIPAFDMRIALDIIHAAIKNDARQRISPRRIFAGSAKKQDRK